jgi:hypothetical protein
MTDDEPDELDVDEQDPSPTPAGPLTADQLAPLLTKRIA